MDGSSTQERQAQDQQRPDAATTSAVAAGGASGGVGQGRPAPGTPGKTIDIARIMHAIPHRYPMLLIDRVVDLHPNVSAVGIKNLSINEPFFTGHFPGHPVMPAVLIIESMAQTAAVLVVETLGDDVAGRVVYFMTVEGAKFRRPVVPGDQLRIHCSKLRNRGNVWKFAAVATVDGVEVAEATYSAMIMAEPAG